MPLRPVFTNALTVERAFGARWYSNRSLDGFFLGPEAMFQHAVIDYPQTPYRAGTYAAGIGVRAGWFQRFGDRFMASASAALNGQLAWMTTPNPAQTLNVGLEVALAAGRDVLKRQ